MGKVEGREKAALWVGQTDPIWDTWICASGFAGADPSSPIGLTGAYLGLRGKYPLSLR